MDPKHDSFRKKYTSRRDKDFGVRMFWELDTTPIQSPQELTIFDRITESLKRADSRYFLRMVTIYGDFSEYGEDTSIFQKGLYDFDLVVKHMPKRNTYCSASTPNKCDFEKPKKDLLAAHCLKQDINIHTIDNDPPFNILILTSDPDFEELINTLHSYGFVMMLACCSDALSTLGRSAYYKWYWNGMKDGDAPLLPTSHFFPPEP